MSDASVSSASPGPTGARGPRRLLMAGVAVLVTGALVGVIALASRSGDDGSETGDVVVPATTSPPETVPAVEPEADADEESTDDASEGESADEPEPEPEPPATSGGGSVADTPITAEELFGGPDPAEEYLGSTEFVLERSVEAGQFELRRSTVSYGELFGLAWDLPTGSFDECLGNAALFASGTPGEQAALTPFMGAGYRTLWGIAQQPGAGDGIAMTYLHVPNVAVELIVVAAPDADEVELRDGDTAIDRSPVVDGLGLVVIAFQPSYALESAVDPMIVALAGGQAVDSTHLWGGPIDASADPCLPPGPPQPSLPEPGVQPDDPAAAESAIRAAHAELVDQTDDTPDKLERLLDDPTGVAEAVEAMRAGQFAESAAGAEYDVGGFSFTAPDEAYFEYTIIAPTGTFGNRFGRAVLVDGNWKITRATICQDLSLAGGPCLGAGGSTDPIQPGGLTPAELDAWYLENQGIVERYWQLRDCHPLSACWSSVLPDAGDEQPADVAAAAADVTAAIESLVDLGTPISDELDLLDDPTGVEAAASALGSGGLVEDASAEVSEVVFVSAEEAWFEFELLVDTGSGDGSFGFRLGRSVLVDGAWRITRATMCDLLALGGQRCEPGWVTEVPPR